MIYAELRGGLGNQLFQIFATIAYAIQHDATYYFPDDTYLVPNDNTGLGKRPTYWDSFLSNLKKYTIPNPTHKMNMYRFMEDGLEYKEIPEKMNLSLYGFFQSEKYFKKEFNAIRNLIGIETKKKELLDMYPRNYSNTISVHFRLGDYKKLADYHPIATYKYYKNAIHHILNETSSSSSNYYVSNVLYFCEKDPEDNSRVSIAISLLKKEFPCLTFVPVEEDMPDWKQMLTMSLCKHNIIANSSFSWWGAYFNSDEEKIVCYPSEWFGPKNQHLNTHDLCPESWIKI